ncbi:hypothetical protein [Paenibacillus cremeus]|uniref:Uncharacterized protein n=1 Tax=Paenibacillus cremeus TaxID=2163881 RepID=A0A559K481_9BACL|nr:hypothetical protein [Paenibacillus cremeus]TVY06917.1 hypothetical protein FPZ49_26750 [Paenibacillus cremeus]
MSDLKPAKDMVELDGRFQRLMERAKQLGGDTMDQIHEAIIQTALCLGKIFEYAGKISFYRDQNGLMVREYDDGRVEEAKSPWVLVVERVEEIVAEKESQRMPLDNLLQLGDGLSDERRKEWAADMQASRGGVDEPAITEEQKEKLGKAVFFHPSVLKQIEESDQESDEDLITTKEALKRVVREAKERQKDHYRGYSDCLEDDKEDDA